MFVKSSLILTRGEVDFGRDAHGPAASGAIRPRKEILIFAPVNDNDSSIHLCQREEL